MTSLFEYPQPRIQAVWVRVLLALGCYLFGSGILSGGLVALTFYKRFLPEGDPETWNGLEVDPAMMEGILLEPLAQWELLFGSALAGGLVVWIMRRFVDRRPLSSLGWPGTSRFVPGFVMGCIFGTLLAVVSVLLITAIGHRHIRVSGFGGEYGWALAFLVVTLLVSFCEEWFFRGYVFTNLRDHGGRVPAILWSAVFFSGLHLGNPSAGAMGMFNIFLLGVILGMLRDITGSWAAGAGLHAAWNLMLGMVLGVGLSGFRIPSLFQLHLEDLSPVLGGGGFGPEGSLVVTIILLGAGGWLLFRYIKNLSKTLGGDHGSD